VSETRWRAFQEAQAIDGRLLRVIAKLAPRGPRAAIAGRAPRVTPKTRAKVSVVIPCYNYGHFLREAVESALAQRGVEVEIIIVDDRSTDDSREVATMLADRHPEVQLVVNTENSGHVRSFNAGWMASSGEYAVKLDADDLLTADSLSRAVALFEAHPSVGLVYGHPRHFESAVAPAGRVSDVHWTVWGGREWLGERCRLGVSAITNPEMVLRSSLLRASGAMNPTVAYAPDMEISLRMAALADVGYVGGADQALHREHAGSMSETDGSGTLVDLEARRAAFSSALQELTNNVESVRFHRRADRALAEDALRFAAAAADRGRDRGEYMRLLEFARGVHPDSVDWPVYRRLASRSRVAGIDLLRSIGRKAARRARQETYFSRWMVSGV